MPAIVLFTDFGLDGPYVGQMKAVLSAAAPRVPIIDLMHHAPSFDPRASAYLLAALVKILGPGSVVCAVVDPGVGSERMPLVIQTDNAWLIGPDNGLLEMSRRQAQASTSYRLDLNPTHHHRTFHGRDLFAPAAARIAQQQSLPMTRLSQPVSGRDWPDDLAEVIYIDAFGNAMTGWRADQVPTNASLQLGQQTLAQASTFSDVPVGTPFWYENSIGLVEIAVNQGHAQQHFELKIGLPITWCDAK